VDSFADAHRLLDRMDDLRQSVVDGTSQTPSVDEGQRHVLCEEFVQMVGPLLARMVDVGILEVSREQPSGTKEVFHPVRIDAGEDAAPVIVIDEPCPEHRRGPAVEDVGTFDVISIGGKSQLERHTSDQFRAALVTLGSLEALPASEDTSRLMSLRERVLPMVAQLVSAFIRAGLVQMDYVDRNARSVQFSLTGVSLDPQRGKVVVRGHVMNVSSPPPRLHTVA
jgi:hypothetical protein